MDGDGRPELLAGSGGDWVSIHESTGDNEFERIWEMEYFPERHGRSTAVGYARDMDGNGRHEAIFYSVSQQNVALLRIVEAVADDSFEVVWECRVSGTYSDHDAVLSVGDVDGDSTEDFALMTSTRIYVFKCTGVAEYDILWERPNDARQGMALRDVNSDGQHELLHAGVYETLVWEWLPVGIGERERRMLDAVQIHPSVAARGAAVRLTGLERGTSIEILDASGRVAREVEGNVIHTAGLPAGAYFVRLSSGGVSVHKKLLVLP